MYRFLPVALIALLITRPVAAEGLQQQLEALHAKSDVPAIAVALAVGDEVELAAVGLRRADGEETVEVGDAWHIGSCTKAVTALLAGRLVDRGVLTWETTVADVLDHLPASVGSQARGLTLKQLLSHTTGLPGREADGIVLPIGRIQELMENPFPAQRRAAAMAVLSLEPVAKSGEQWGYLNGGYIVASVMLEAAAGEPFEELMQRAVFEPLNITSAGWGPPAEVRGHTRQGNGWHPTELDNPKVYDAAGRLHVSLGDWVKLCRPLLEEGDGYLSASSREVITTAVSDDPAYALGWALADDPTLGRFLTHSGSNTVWLAQAVIVPDRDAVLLVAINAHDANLLRRATQLLSRTLIDRQ